MVKCDHKYEYQQYASMLIVLKKLDVVRQDIYFKVCIYNSDCYSFTTKIIKTNFYSCPICVNGKKYG